MKTTPLWRVLLLLVIVSLACSFTSSGSYLPPTETPRAVADDDQDEEEEEQDQEEEEDQEEEDVDLDQDLDLGGLGGDDDEEQDEDQQDEEEQDQEEEEEQDQEEEEEQDQEEEEEQEEQDQEEEEEQDQGDDCAPFRASSDVFWVSLNQDFEIEEQVSSYPSGATLITPVFEYDCVPSNVDLVSVFSYEGEVVYSDEESLQSNTRSGIYGYPLGTTDDSPLGDGQWGVEFYVDDNLIGGGNVQVGGDGQEQTTNELVPVEGSVVSASSGQPIEDALVLILLPGVTVQAWADADYPDSDVYTGAESNSRGEFTLEEPLERNVEYSLVVVADGFQPLAVDGFVIDNSLEPPVFLEIELAE